MASGESRHFTPFGKAGAVAIAAALMLCLGASTSGPAGKPAAPSPAAPTAGASQPARVVAAAAKSAGTTTIPATRPTWPETRATVRLQQTVLYTKPANATIIDTVASPDCRHFGAVEQAGQNYRVRIDGVASRELEWVVANTLRFSPDNRRFSYVIQRQGMMYVVIGTNSAPASATESKGYFFVGGPVFSPDGGHVAFGAQAEKSGKFTLVVDGKETGSYDQIDDQQIVFSPDGTRLAYRATRGRQQFFVVDGKEQPGADAVIGARFSADGRRLGYRAKRGDNAFAVIDGQEGPRYEIVAGLVFTRDGRRAAYAAGRNGRQMLVTDDGPPGKSLPKEYLPFDGLGDVGFSPDGRRLGITVQTSNHWNVVVDGKQGSPYDGTSPILFSPDSRRFVYMAAREGRRFMVIDGVEGPAFTEVGKYTFTPDGRHVVYAVVRGEEGLLFVDDRRFAPLGLFSLSPDSRHIAHTIARPDRRLALALDGEVVDAADNAFDGFPRGSDLIFDSPGLVRMLVAKGPNLLRVEMLLNK